MEGLQGVEVIIDDIVVTGDDKTHYDRLRSLLQRASSKGLRLNKDKCKIRQTEVPYVRHLLTANGLKIDPQKVKTVEEMPEPQNKKDVKRVLPSQVVHRGCTSRRT